jgi:hypothetical protein
MLFLDLSHYKISLKRLVINFKAVSQIMYRLCGLSVRIAGYRSRGPGSIPVAARLSEK